MLVNETRPSAVWPSFRPRLPMPSRRSNLLLPARALVLTCAACLLTACGASNNVVVEPVNLPKIDPRLMVPPRLAVCPLPPRERYAMKEITAQGTCFRADRDYHASHVRGLQKAVRAREKAIAEIKKAATL